MCHDLFFTGICPWLTALDSNGGFHVMEKEPVKPSEPKLLVEKALNQICTTQSNKFTSNYQD